MGRISARYATFLGVLLIAGASALADEAPNAGDIPIPAREVEWDVIEDRILKGMWEVVGPDYRSGHIELTRKAS